MAKFINPYGFVQLGESKRIPPKGEENLTGYIKYQLKTKTSIFIPNTTSDKAFNYIPTKNDKGEADDPFNEHILQDFFSINNLDNERTYDDIYFEPQIPGSEIRGVIRNIYETITSSCVSKVNDNIVIGKRTVEHFLPGVLKREKGEYKLYESKDTLLRNKSNFSVHTFEDGSLPIDGTAVNVTLSKANKYAKEDVVSLEGKIEGYIIKGNQGPELAPNKYIIDNKCPNCVMKSSCDKKRCWSAEKHCAHVLVINKDGKNYHISKQELDNLGFVIKQYQEENENAYKEYENTYNDFINENVDALPVYYSVISSGYIMMSPACITREVYKNKVGDSLGTFRACTPGADEKDRLCAACSLFGLANSGGFSKGSRIRFTDLKLSDIASYNGQYKKCYDEKLYVMPELAQPKISNSEFYLVKPNDPEGEVWFWTYDYYTVKKANGTLVIKEYTPTISGRKYYWHGQKITGSKHKTNRNKTVRTVKEGVCFEGRIYFDGISKKQLDQLLFILNYTSDEKSGFKIGSGKSVGLGSVCINVTEKVTRIFDGVYKNDEYLSDNNSWENLDFDSTVKSSFDCITRFLSDDDIKLVHYPGVNSENDDGFTWFVNNKINHKLRSYAIGENGLKQNDDRPDNSPRSRIQTRILQTLDPPEHNKYLNESQRVGYSSEDNKKNISKKYSDSFIEDEVYEAQIKGYKQSDKGKPYYVRAQIKGTSISFPCKLIGLEDATKASVGSKVKLKFAGYDDKGYTKWNKA